MVDARWTKSFETPDPMLLLPTTKATTALFTAHFFPELGTSSSVRAEGRLNGSREAASHRCFRGSAACSHRHLRVSIRQSKLAMSTTM